MKTTSCQVTVDAIFVVVNQDSESLLGIGNIRKLNLDLNSLVYGKVTKPTIHSISYRELNLNDLLQKFKPVFEEGLGHCTQLNASIKLQDNSSPKLFKPRPIPFSRLEATKIEIQRLQEKNIIEPVSFTDWAAPVVVIPKSDGSVRICGDFKVTINPCMKVNQYPIPNIDELLSRLNGGDKFTKLDFSDAYLQIELDDDSKPLTTISTPFGFFRYKECHLELPMLPLFFKKSLTKSLLEFLIVVFT